GMVKGVGRIRTCKKLKSLAALIVAVFALHVAASPAAAGLRTNGSLGLDFSLRRSPSSHAWMRSISTSLNLNAELFPGDRDNARVVVLTSGWTDNMSNSEELSIIPQNLNVRSSYLELTTSLWAGGPQWLL